MARNTALITGASSGLGREFARLAAEDGYHVVLVARRREALERLADELNAQGATTTVVELDLAEPGAAAWLVGQLEGLQLQLDLLVNNAGAGQQGAFADMPADRVDGIVALNVAAVTQLARAVLPGMLARRQGRILNVASTAAYQPGPFMAVYYASKAYILSLSEALWEETRGTGVTVTALCPGPTRTEFQDKAGMAGTRLFNSGMIQVQDAATVAERGYEAMLDGRRVVVPGLANRIAAALSPLLPRRLVLRTVRRLQGG